jgi:streptogramin lyase
MNWKFAAAGFVFSLAWASAADAIEFVSYDAPGTTADGHILRGSDGNIFFTQGPNKLSRVTPAGAVNGKRIGTPSDSRIGGVAVGPNADLWIADDIAGSIGTIQPHVIAPRAKATLSEHALPKGYKPKHMAVAPDGNFWVSDSARSRLLWVRGTFFIEHKIPTDNAGVGAMTVDNEGNLWFTETNAGKIARAMPGGVISEYPLPSRASRPAGIATGSDGAVWWTDPGANMIGRIDTESLVIAEFPLPSRGSAPDHITAGSDGNLWYTATAINKIGRVATDGSITEFDLPADGALQNPGAITTGFDGNLWFLAKDRIGVLKAPAFNAPSALLSTFSLELAKQTALENARSVTLLVTRSGNTTTRASIDYSVGGMSALPGQNYVPATGTLEFAPDEVAKSVTIPILDDNTVTIDKAFKVKLSRPSNNAAIGNTPETIITITDMDAPSEDTAPSGGGSLG